MCKTGFLTIVVPVFLLSMLRLCVLEGKRGNFCKHKQYQGMLPHELKLEVGIEFMLAKNLKLKKGDYAMEHDYWSRKCIKIL